MICYNILATYFDTGISRRKEKNMKETIHPKYYNDTKVICTSCGAEFTTGSTVKEIHVDTCSHCHPFYTGKQKLMDTAGRVEKFNKRYSVKTEN